MLKVSLVLISGNHFVVLGRNSLTPEELKDEPLYKIPIIGLFRSKLFFSSDFASADAEHPEYAGLAGIGCKGHSTESHDFAMIILRARLAIFLLRICMIDGMFSAAMVHA